MKASLSILFLAALLGSARVHGQPADRLLLPVFLDHLMEDPVAKNRLLEIEAFLLQPENEEKFKACMESALTCRVNALLAKSPNLMKFDSLVGAELGREYWELVYSRYLKDIKETPGRSQFMSFEVIPHAAGFYPPYEKIKPCADMFETLLKAGRPIKEVVGTIEMMYPEEYRLLAAGQTALAGSDIYQKGGGLTLDEVGSVSYLRYLLRQNYMKQVRDRLYDPAKYACNDLEFCKSRILKAMDGKADDGGGNEGIPIRDNAGDFKGIPHYELDKIILDPDGKSGKIQGDKVKSLVISGRGAVLELNDARVEMVIAGSLPKEIKDGDSAALKLELVFTGNSQETRASVVFGGAQQDSDCWVGRSKLHGFERIRDGQTLVVKPLTRKSRGHIVEISLNTWAWPEPILVARLVYMFKPQ